MYIDNIANCLTGKNKQLISAIPEMKEYRKIKAWGKPDDYNQFRKWILSLQKNKWMDNNVIAIYDRILNRQWDYEVEFVWMTSYIDHIIQVAQIAQ